MKQCTAATAVAWNQNQAPWFKLHVHLPKLCIDRNNGVHNDDVSLFNVSQLSISIGTTVRTVVDILSESHSSHHGCRPHVYGRD